MNRNCKKSALCINRCVLKPQAGTWCNVVPPFTLSCLNVKNCELQSKTFLCGTVCKVFWPTLQEEFFSSLHLVSDIFIWFLWFIEINGCIEHCCFREKGLRLISVVTNVIVLIDLCFFFFQAFSQVKGQGNQVTLLFSWRSLIIVTYGSLKMFHWA